MKDIPDKVMELRRAGKLVEAVDLARKSGDERLLAHTIRHLADVHRRLGQLSEAEPFYVEALAIYRQSQSTAPLEFANALRPLALLKEGQSKKAEAKQIWEEAKSLYQSVSIDAGVEECDEAIRRCTSSLRR